MCCPSRSPIVAFISLALAVCAACAHAETWSDGVLRKGDLTLRIGPVPSSWRRIDVEGAELAFRDDARAGSVLLNVRCGARDDDAPLSVLTDHLIMGTTEREVQSEEIIPFDGREAMHRVLRAKLDGVPMQYDIYVMKKDGCVHDLVYVAPPSHFAEGSAEFERFSQGLHAQSSPQAIGIRRAGSQSSDP